MLMRFCHRQLCARTDPHSSSSLDPRAASGKASRELLIASGAELAPESLPVAGGRTRFPIFPPRRCLSSRKTALHNTPRHHARSPTMLETSPYHHIISCVIGPAPVKARSRDGSRDGSCPSSAESPGCWAPRRAFAPKVTRGAIRRVCGLDADRFEARGSHLSGYLGAFRGTAPAPGRPFRLEGCLPDSAMTTSSSRG
jgi:hypothetical protein